MSEPMLNKFVGLQLDLHIRKTRNEKISNVDLSPFILNKTFILSIITHYARRSGDTVLARRASDRGIDSSNKLFHVFYLNTFMRFCLV